MAGGDDRKNFALEPYEVKSMKQLRLFAAVCAALLAVAAPAAGLEKPKYIFLFIGDGMGAPAGSASLRNSAENRSCSTDSKPSG